MAIPKLTLYGDRAQKGFSKTAFIQFANIFDNYFLEYFLIKTNQKACPDYKGKLYEINCKNPL